MNSLDSRVIGFGNCFCKKFGQAGKVSYMLVTAAGIDMPFDKERSLNIHVKKAHHCNKQSQQHTVTVSGKGNQFTVDPLNLEIEEGDSVLWHAANANVAGFAIRGNYNKKEFDSSCIEEEAVYTHAFGTPGKYKWVDAYGSKVQGVINVCSPDKKGKKTQREWLKKMSEGVLICINGDEVSPKKVDLITGQTVFWAVNKAPGISITDSRLI